MLKPSVRQMLMIGKDMGFEYIYEAYDSYMMHYDCFFLLDKYEEQYEEFLKEMKIYGFVADNGCELKNLTIDQALIMMRG